MVPKYVASEAAMAAGDGHSLERRHRVGSTRFTVNANLTSREAGGFAVERHATLSLDYDLCTTSVRWPGRGGTIEKATLFVDFC